MKKALFLLVLAGTAFATGCSKDDDSPKVYDYQNYDGMWVLAHVSGSIAGIDHDYDGSIIWNFDTEHHILSVVNNDADETVEDFLESGTYTYSFDANTVTPETCAETFNAGNLDFGCFVNNGNTIVLTQNESDGYVLTFNRIMTLD
ncbi:hypothetical protein [Flavobacterium subsaxonicum]|uniref:Lipocalin-like domain-containing protein n=1 Tax=Flavobacterium subsaxonicum WB 4.1-42 = DSM 21790 TaxID=1121898 RepID=A0A0A2MF07_9FLAO|nr:hypothetical protein [Flavobacterium subsaxonicum]KGO91252.1 hypothetical protein Q766_19035 [Flavobacterium subsaxonicum WB 4.1-42 = DSM 21790]